MAARRSGSILRLARVAGAMGALCAAAALAVGAAPVASASLAPVEATTAYQPAGTAVTGADVLSESAPRLDPGQYLDTFAVGGTGNSSDPQGTTKYYTIPAIEGSTYHVSATVIPPGHTAEVDDSTVSSLGVTAKLRAKDNHECDSTSQVEILTSGVKPTIATLTDQVGGTTWSSRCPVSGVLILEVQRTGDAFTAEALAVEIDVRIEPPVETGDLPEAAEEGDAVAMVTHGQGTTPINGGTSFNDAVALTGQVTYSDTVATGEARYYAIPLSWGQRFAYTITEVGPPTPELDFGSSATVDVFNPVREEVQMTDWNSGGQQWFAGRSKDPFSAATSYPVRYTNRDGAQQAHTQLDGTYYLRLATDYADPASSTSFLVSVQVLGDPEPAPDYLPLGSVLITSASAGVTSTVTSVASGYTAPDTTASTTGAPVLAGDGSPSSGGDRNWALVAVAVVAVAAGAALLVLLWRFRRSGSPPAQH